MNDSPRSPRAGARVLTIPNALTILRIVIIPFFLAASVRGAFDLAFVLFIAGGLTDALDGFIARRYNQRSTLGAVLDPAADKMMMVPAFLVYTLSGAVTHKLPDWLTLTVFLRDILIVVVAYLLYTRIRIRRFPPSVPGKISTICQIVALATAIAANATFPYISPFATFFLPIIATLTLIATLYSGFDYLRKGDEVVRGVSQGM